MTREIKERDVYDDYEKLQDISEGSMGSVTLVQKKREGRNRKSNDCFLFGGFVALLVRGVNHREACRYYALKTIKVNQVEDPSFIRELRNEIEILELLDHPNIVRAIATYEYHNHIAIVMELCSGGDLFSRDPYTEDRARHIVRQITSAVAYMHRCGIMHRGETSVLHTSPFFFQAWLIMYSFFFTSKDLKFENVMFESPQKDANIKIIDYGLSKKFEYQGQHLDDGVGTIYSMAPEVMKGDYGTQADLWSIGVITFMLLSSTMPFGGFTGGELMKRIHLGEFSFTNPRWHDVSAESCRFISSLIVVDPVSRLTAEQALRHTWLDADFKRQEAISDTKSMLFLIRSLERYVNYCKLKKLALVVIAHKSTGSEIGELRKAFEEFDLSRATSVTFEQFKEVLKRFGCEYDENQLQRLFRAIDLDGSGEIDYTEFIAATIEARGAIVDERLAEAFNFFDGDYSGYITKDSLRTMQYGLLGRNFRDEYVDEIIDECDLNHDGIISFKEFMALWGRE